MIKDIFWLVIAAIIAICCILGIVLKIAVIIMAILAWLF